jgi:large subunit ribosomal protein L19
MLVVNKIKSYPPPPSLAARCKNPVAALHDSQIALLDPDGERTKLFSRGNPDAAKVGDVLLVHLKNGDPFAGVCINIRRVGVETGILLRNELTKVGVEMWYKIYSPNIESIEIVQRREKRARRARLTYMRKPGHDMGSVQNLVLQYQRQRSVLAGGRRDKRNGKGK